MDDPKPRVGVFKGAVLLTQGLLLFVLMIVLTNLSAVGFDRTVLNGIVGSLRLQEFGFVYETLQFVGLAMAVFGPLWYWFGYPMYSYLRVWLRERDADSEPRSSLRE